MDFKVISAEDLRITILIAAVFAAILIANWLW